MNAKELKSHLTSGALAAYSNLYADVNAQTERLINAIDSFTAEFGEGRELMLLSVPGRSEILGNHTDHNRGKVMAGAIDRDIIAVVARREDGIINLHSEGYPADTVRLSDCENPDAFENYSSGALVGGMVGGFIRAGYAVGGFDAYSTTEVLKGSGISSSAAFEVMIGNILSHLYNEGKIANEELAKIAQFAENVYFGKPCGLMDQMACAVGGFVYIDFEDAKSPIVEPIPLSPKEQGYALCIVNTGGNHADLNEDYASVPREMKAVAAALGREVLVGTTEAELIAAAPALRETLGDRALLRAFHFVRECERVERAALALKGGDLNGLFTEMTASGSSSFRYLQNVYTTINVSEQGLSLALCLADGYLLDRGAYRVHGGGFAGTVQAFVPEDMLEGFTALMDGVFGEGATLRLNVRPVGACRLF